MTKAEISERDQKKVLKECARWGVTVHLETVPPWTEGWRDGPSHGGIDWPSRTIYWSPTNHWNAPHYLLHELAHVVIGEDPDTVAEMTSAILAIEYEAARRLKLKDYGRWAAGYVATDDGYGWGEISTIQRGKMLSASRKVAIEKHLLGADGKPTYKQISADQ